MPWPCCALFSLRHVPSWERATRRKAETEASSEKLISHSTPPLSRAVEDMLSVWSCLLSSSSCHVDSELQPFSLPFRLIQLSSWTYENNISCHSLSCLSSAHSLLLPFLFALCRVVVVFHGLSSVACRRDELSLWGERKGRRRLVGTHDDEKRQQRHMNEKIEKKSLWKSVSDMGKSKTIRNEELFVIIKQMLDMISSTRERRGRKRLISDETIQAKRSSEAYSAHSCSSGVSSCQPEITIAFIRIFSSLIFKDFPALFFALSLLCERKSSNVDSEEILVLTIPERSKTGNWRRFKCEIHGNRRTFSRRHTPAPSSLAV